MADHGKPGWGFWARWSVATAVGWVVGGFAAFPLSALLVQPILGRETNLIVGACIGAGVGWFQARAVRGWLRLGWSWTLGSALVMALPFIVDVVYDSLSVDAAASPFRALLIAIGLAGGLAGVAVQVGELRAQVARPALWLVAAGVAWGLTLALRDVVGLVGSGVVLGVVSGALLVALLRRWPGAVFAVRVGGDSAEAVG